MNYFELFELVPSIEIDKSDLRRKYYLKTREYHPDMHGLNTDDHKLSMLDKSSEINKAYKVLSDDIERIRYILEISGIEFAEGKETVPRDFLMEVMDINELILDFKMSSGNGGEEAERIKEDISKQLTQLKNNLQNNIEGIIKNYDYQKTDKKQLELIKDYYLKSKYLSRIESNLEN